MRITSLSLLGAAAAAIVLAGCSGSGSSAVAPGSVMPQMGVHHQFAKGVPVAVSPRNLLKVNMNTGIHFKSFNACPKSGNLVYMSDFNNSVVNIYSGAKLALCGQITGMTNPQGMYVLGHDLYVAATGSNNVQAFHRGSTTPFRTYTDTATQQYPVDVTIAPDHTVIVSNIFSPTGTEQGSIDTFTLAGHFRHNYPMTNDIEGLFITVADNGTVYFNDIDSTTGAGKLWRTKCPLGVCAAQHDTGVTYTFPGGLTESATEDIVGNDQSAFTGDTFELPGTTPATFSFGTSDDQVGMALNYVSHSNNKWYTGDASADALQCFKYKQTGSSSGSCGTTAGNASGLPIGVATDPANPQ